MAQLIVHNIETEIVTRLKQRAAAHGRSIEAEHREILRSAVQSDSRKQSFKEALLAMPEVGDDSDFERHAHRGLNSQAPIIGTDNTAQ
jgi:plasmid stability protein